MAGKAFSIEEVAERLGLSTDTIRRHIADGKLECSQVGRQYIVTLPDLERYLDSKERAAAIFGGTEQDVDEGAERKEIDGLVEFIGIFLGVARPDEMNEESMLSALRENKDSWGDRICPPQLHVAIYGLVKECVKRGKLIGEVTRLRAMLKDIEWAANDEGCGPIGGEE